MKKLLTVALSVVLLAGLSVAAVRHYQTYKNHKVIAAVAAAKVEADKVAAVKQSAAAEYQGLVSKYNSLQAECQKGVQAYDLLTPAIKAKVSAPNCGNALH